MRVPENYISLSEKGQGWRTEQLTPTKNSEEYPTGIVFADSVLPIIKDIFNIMSYMPKRLIFHVYSPQMSALIFLPKQEITVWSTHQEGGFDSVVSKYCDIFGKYYKHSRIVGKQRKNVEVTGH